ncbi:hypothetical protein GCM10023347_47780 [Streptomyces chumphonensis]|uniref:Lipoprotein n=1 Tax=Streptomyces chumphonensis TaxID=1214925 RepID=A0A927F0L7_9ACTN|nr:hypothetical protein [Streptomyces chumphonensis]MBD3932948.1 hypothetical protein [Streptomyces chumphonensis]
METRVTEMVKGSPTALGGLLLATSALFGCTADAGEDGTDDARWSDGASRCVTELRLGLADDPPSARAGTECRGAPPSRQEVTVVIQRSGPRGWETVGDMSNHAIFEPGAVKRTDTDFPCEPGEYRSWVTELTAYGATDDDARPVEHSMTHFELTDDDCTS